MIILVYREEKWGYKADRSGVGTRSFVWLEKKDLETGKVYSFFIEKINDSMSDLEKYKLSVDEENRVKL
jgi:hypothetical protein